MNESRGTVKTAMLLRTAYMECDNGIDFARYCYRVFDMTGFSASLCFELIDVIGDLGVVPDESHPIMERPQADTEWQPFETAPTDGTEIQVWREDAGVFVAVCREDDIEGPDRLTWWSDGEDLTGNLPTLWKPLSAAPEVKP